MRPTDVPPRPENRGNPAKLFIAVTLFFAAGVAIMSYAVLQWNATAKARNLKNPVPAAPQTVAAGKSVYENHCQSCHGEHGDGKGEKAAELSTAPGDFTDAAKMSGLTDGELFVEITKGRHPMPAFRDKLSPQERWEVVDFLRTFAAKPGARLPSTQP